MYVYTTFPPIFRETGGARHGGNSFPIYKISEIFRQSDSQRGLAITVGSRENEAEVEVAVEGSG
jgi:hypothetical protein